MRKVGPIGGSPTALAIDRRTVGRYIRQQRSRPVSKCSHAPIEPGRVAADSKCTTAPPGPVRGRIRAVRPLFPRRGAGQPNQSLRSRGGSSFWPSARKGSLPSGFIKTCVASLALSVISYDSVRRFLKRLGAQRPLPFRRMECEPGAGGAGRLRHGCARSRRPKASGARPTCCGWCSRIRARRYSEACYRQTAEDFLRVLENAFWHFGGVPQTLVVDNLKAAVLRPDWFDPELESEAAIVRRALRHGDLADQAAHAAAQGQGRARRGYVQDNGLKARDFSSLEAQNRHLASWEASVADTRIHGTTKRQVGKVFREVERAALLPLPAERFPFFHEAQRIVSRDGHIEVAKAYYSVPPEYLGRTVWARWDARLVRVFDQRLEQIAVHARQRAGQVQHARRAPGGREDQRHRTGRDVAACRKLELRRAGPCVGRRDAENAAELRAFACLQGLLALSKRHACEAIDEACKTALLTAPFACARCGNCLKHRGPDARTTAVSGRASDDSSLGRLWRLGARRFGGSRGKGPAGPPGSFPQTPNPLPLFSSCVPFLLRSTRR